MLSSSFKSESFKGQSLDSNSFTTTFDHAAAGQYVSTPVSSERALELGVSRTEGSPELCWNYEGMLTS